MTERHPLRWGILATGGIARNFVQDLKLAGLNVVAVGSRSLESAQRFADEFNVPRAHGSYAELVADDDVDIVYIATPHPMHCANTLLAVEHGKHALVEKPFTLNKAEAEQLRTAARANGVLVTEAMWTRYLPHMVRIREIIAEGGIGEVRALFADHMQLFGEDPQHRLNSLALGGGALLDLGVYPVSLAYGILGAPESVQATGRLGATGADTEVGVVMRHSGNAISTVLTSSRASGPNTAHIIGSKGRIDIDRIWYTSAGFTHYNAEGAVVEEFSPDISGRGMQFQAIAAEEYVALGNFDGELITVDDSVEIMGVLDEIRRQIGVVYPGENAD